MIRISKPIGVLAVIGTLVGCSDAPRAGQQQDTNPSVVRADMADAVTTDWSDWDWPAAEVAALTKRAEAGDIEAAQRLWDYYIIQEDGRNARYWQDWLFERDDPESMDARVEELYRSARRRPPDDPHKMVQLREAERIYALLERAEPDRRDSYMMEDIRAEIAAAKAGKVRHIQSEQDAALDLKASELFDQAMQVPDHDPEKLTTLRLALAHYNRMSRQMSAMDETTLRGSGLSYLLRPGERAVASRTLVEREIQRLEN